MKFIIFKLLLITLLSFTLSLPLTEEEDVEPTQEEVNKLLFGEPNPEWIKYVNEDGHFDESLVPPNTPVDVPVIEPQPFYDAARKVKFWVYTRSAPSRTQVILEDLESIKATTFNPKHPIRFVIHGWQNDERSDAIQLVKNAYLAKGDFNVFCVDWSNGAKSIEYYSSRHRVEQVGDVVKRFIVFLVKNMGVKLNQIQLVGHSLGAHIAGFTGKKMDIGRIPVIIGLDPAGPLFSYKKTAKRLHTTDADYVEIIHTAAGSLGMDQPMGAVDFYPNYGRAQPGCGLDLAGACAHGRSFEFFAESITSDQFWSNQCVDYTQISKKRCAPTGVKVTMGTEPVKVSKAKGLFHLETNKKKPFAKGQI